MTQNPTLAVLALLTLAAPAFAHPDYDSRLTFVQGADGEKLSVVLHYTDGIIGNDPVKLQLVDPKGRVIAETPYARDYVTLDAGDGRLFVFGVDMVGLSFWNGWQLDRGTLTELPASPGLAISANLRAHWLAYGLSTLLCCAAVTTYVRRARKAAKRFVKLTWLESLAVLWLPLTFMYGNLSLLLIACLTLLGLLPVFVVLRYDRKPRPNAASAKGLVFGQMESRGF